MSWSRWTCALSLIAGLAFAQSANAERLVQSTTEARTLLHYKAEKALVEKLLPVGWVSNPGTGSLKDANLTITLIDGIAAANAEGHPIAHPGKVAVLNLPAKHEQTGRTAAMIVAASCHNPKRPQALMEPMFPPG